MNRIYSLVYNVVLGQVQVASELGGNATGTVARPPERRPLRRLPMALAIGLGLCGSLHAQTVRELNGVLGGTATFSADGSTITQGTKKAILDWKTFNIAAGDALNVEVPLMDSSAVTLNLVNEGISSIDGTLNSPGHFFLINPRGVVFGSTASVNVAGLLASSASLTVGEDDLPAGFNPDTGVDDGTLSFTMPPLAQGVPAQVMVEGGARINATSSVLLIGEQVNNAGTIEAPQIGLAGYQIINNGTLEAGAAVALQGGMPNASVDYSQTGVPAVTQAVPANTGASAQPAAVINEGLISAPAVSVMSHAGAINLGGQIVATSHLHIQQKGDGGVLLTGQLGADAAAGGTGQSSLQTTLDSRSGVNQTSGWLKTGQLNLGLGGAGPAEPASESRSVQLLVTANEIASVAGQVEGNLKLATAHQGTVVQHGALQVAGDTQFQASQAALRLDHADNRFGGAVFVQGSGIALTAAGNLTLGQVVNVGGGALKLASTGGSITAHSALSGSTLDIESAGNVTFNADVTATDDLLVSTSGGDIRQAGGTVIDVTGVTQLTTGNATPVNGDVILNNAGNKFAGKLEVAGSQVKIRSGLNSALQLGNVSANSLEVITSSGIDHQGTMTVRGDATLNTGNASLAINNATVTGNLVASGSNITQTGMASVAGKADLDATGTIALVDFSAGALDANASAITQTGTLQVGGLAKLEAGGAINLTGVTAGTLTVDAGGILQINTAAVAGHAGLSAGNRMTLTGVEAGSLNAAANALNVSAGVIHGSASLTARDNLLNVDGLSVGGDLTATGVGIAQTGTLGVAGEAALDSGAGVLAMHNAILGQGLIATGGRITQTGTAAVGGTAELDSTDAIALNDFKAKALDATASAITQTGTLTVYDDAILTARNGSVALHNANVGKNLSATGGSITQTGTLMVGGMADLDASGAITLAGVTANALNADAGTTLQINTAAVTGYADLEAVNSMTLTGVEAGSLQAAANALNVSAGVIHGVATLTAQNSTLSVDGLSVDGNLLATGVGITQAGSLRVTGNATLLAAGGALRLSSVDVGGALQATATGITQTGTLAVDGRATLNAGNGALAIHNASVGENLLAIGASITQTGTTTVTGKANLNTTGAIAMVDFKAGALDATGSAINQTGTLQVTGLADLAATDEMALAGVTAGSLKARATDSLRINGANVSGLADLAAGNSMTLAGVQAVSLLADSKALTVTSGVIHGSAQMKATGSTLIIDTLQVGGNLQATGAGIAQTGTLRVAGAAALNAGSGTLTINNASVGQNLTATAASITQAGTASVTGKADLDTPGAIALVDFKAGALDAAAAAITQTGTLQVTGLADLAATDEMALAGVTAGTLMAHAGDTLQLNGANVSGLADLTADNAMTLAGVAAGSLNAAADALSMNASVIHGSANLTARDSALLLDGLSTGGDLSASGVGITQTGTLQVSGDATLNASAGMLALASVSVGGDLQAAGAGITQAGTLTVGSDATLNAGNGALAINNASVGQNLTATAASITQTGTASVTGKADLDTPGAIALVDFKAGALDAAAAAITQTGTLQVTVLADLAATDEMALAGVRAGTLMAHAGDTLQINGANVSGLADLTADNAITLAGVAAGSLNAAADALSVNASVIHGSANLTARDSALLLDGLSVGGDLSANGMGITQTGTLQVNGDATLNAGAGMLALASVSVGGDLQAAGAGITQAGTLRVGGDATLDAGSSSLSLGAARVGGDLVANGASLAQTGALQVAGGSKLHMSGDIVLDNAGNRFGGPVSLHARQARIVSAGGLNLDTVQAAALQADAGGRLQVKTSTISGAAALSGAGVVLDDVTVGAELQLSSRADISQYGALRVGGNTLLHAAGAITLDDAGNDFAGNLSAHGASIRVADANVLKVQAMGNHAGSGAIHLSAAGDMVVGGQGIDGGSGQLTLQSHTGQVVLDQAVQAGQVTLEGHAGLQLAADITASSTVDLRSQASVAQRGGQITAGHLQASVAGGLALGQVNRIAELGDVRASGLSLVNSGDLLVSGNVQGGPSALLDVREGNLQLQGSLGATDLRLQVAGDITQDAGSVLAADTLSGHSAGSTQLGTETTFVANQVGRLGDFNAAGGFSMTNARSLTLGSLNGSAYSVDTGVADFFLKVLGGDLLQAGQAPVLAGNSHWWSSGAIGQSFAPINLVTSTSLVEVGYAGLPPAYFNAVSRHGGLVVIASAVNMPVVDVGVREQNTTMQRLPYVDVSALDAEYRPFGLVQPGMRLPDDQQAECDAGDPDAECAP